MNEIDAPQSWPPRKGLGFFLLWIVGSIAFLFLYRFVPHTVPDGDVASEFLLKAVSLGPLVVQHGWQGWLLFRRGWRFHTWTWMPLLELDSKSFGAIDIGTAVIFLAVQIVMLFHVRRRSWLWVPVLVASSLASGFDSDRILGWALSASSYLTELGLHLDLLDIEKAMRNGKNLIDGIVVGAALAWLMPPITHEDRAASLSSTPAAA